MGEDKQSKIFNYDSSYFSKKMADVDKKGGSHLGFVNQSANPGAQSMLGGLQEELGVHASDNKRFAQKKN